MDTVTGTGHAVGIASIVIHVTDPDLALPFYREGLGLQVQFDSGWNSSSDMLALSGTPPESRMRIIAMATAKGDRVTLAAFDPTSARDVPFEDAGVIHVGFEVDDLEAALVAVELRGGRQFGVTQVVGPPGRRSRLAFVRDLDHAVIELVQHLPADGPDGEAR